MRWWKWCVWCLLQAAGRHSRVSRQVAASAFVSLKNTCVAPVRQKEILTDVSHSTSTSTTVSQSDAGKYFGTITNGKSTCVSAARYYFCIFCRMASTTPWLPQTAKYLCVCSLVLFCFVAFVATAANTRVSLGPLHRMAPHGWGIICINAHEHKL